MAAATYKKSFKANSILDNEISVFNCGVQSCEAGHSWGPGARDHYLIHYVVSGKGTYTVNRQTFNLSAGDLFIAKPSQIITYTADFTSPWEYYWVGFNGSCAKNLVQKLPFSNNMPVYHCKTPSTIKDSLYNLFLSRGIKDYNEVMMVGYLYIFIATLINDAQSSEERSITSSSQYVFNAVRYIQSNFFHDISVDDIARAIGVSRSHLYRVFMGNMGQSPIDYLTEYRINEACRLLKNTQLNVAEVAVSVGFFDQFYFSRVFKKHKGMPPSKFAACKTILQNAEIGTEET